MKGKVWRYGDNVNTDVIFPGKYTYSIKDPSEMAAHALEDLDSDFAKDVQTGDIIVAGRNFGCGSSREQAAACLKYAGVAAIIAKSFARIYFRNAINFGLPVIQCEQAVDELEKGDEVEIDFAVGIVRAKGKEFSFPPLAEEVLEILNAGGLIPYAKQKIASKNK